MLVHSNGCVVVTNSKWANAKPPNKPWQIFENRIHIRCITHDKFTLFEMLGLSMKRNKKFDFK